MDKSILITGGCGFIGSNLVRMVANRFPTSSLIVVDSLTYAGDRKNIEGVDVIFHQFDITNSVEMEFLFANYDIRMVFHLAAESFVDNSIDSSNVFAKTNVLGTHTLIDVSNRYWKKIDYGECKFIHVSTDEVYGALGKYDESWTEESPYLPNNPYSASKAASDMFVRAYVNTYGFPAIITHCSNNYGIYQHTEKLIPTVIERIYNDEPIPVYGQGLQIRDWIPVDKHCDALIFIANKGRDGEVYNIGADNEVTNIDLVKKICEIMGREPETLISYVKDRLGHDFRYSINSSKLQGLGWKPCVEFKLGLEETVKWYVDKLNKECSDGTNV